MDVERLVGQPFKKMNGLGNDFIILDLRRVAERGRALLSAETVRALANRQFGIGCDQLITMEADSGADVFMGIWNADGSEVSACGNATRCVAWLLMEETGEASAQIRTPVGVLTAKRLGGHRIAVDMGVPKLHWEDIPLAEQMDDTRFIDIKLGPIDNPVLWGPSAVNMGNPHCVFFVDDLDVHKLDRFGPMVENHPLFPERANVSLANVISRQHIRLKVWERGVGITRACGTAACAVLVSAVRRRLTERKATVELDGGTLGIEWCEDDHVIMAGPIEHDGSGVLEAAHFAAL